MTINIATSVLLLLLLSATNGYSLTFQDYLNETAREEVALIGGGLLSSLALMQEQILLYSATSTAGASRNGSIEFYPLNGIPNLQCRIYGYLNACSHPFVEYGGNPNNTDVQQPYELDFGIVADYMQPTANALPDVTHYPLFTAGVVPIFNIPGISRLVLDYDTLAKIFRACSSTTIGCLPGSISMWNDTAIKATNPASIYPLLDAAGKILLLGHAEASNGIVRIFRRALSKFETSFATQVGQGPDSNWKAVNFYGKILTTEALLDGVYRTPFSISFTPVNTLVSSSIGVVDLLENGTNLKVCETNAIAAAAEDFGLAFGNDGRAPDNHTVDLTYSKASRAWPIAYYSYMVVRTNRTDDSCMKKNQILLDFLENFYVPTNPDAFRGLLSTGLAPIPNLYAIQLLDLIRNQLRCNGSLVYNFPAPPPNIIVFGDETSRGTVAILARAFQQISGNENVLITVEPLLPHIEIMQRFQDNKTETGYIVLADENLSTSLLQQDEFSTGVDLLALPYAIMSGAFIYNFCDPNQPSCLLDNQMSGIVLSVQLAALILDGIVTMWNDSSIAALNPGLALPPVAIHVIRGPANNDFYFSFIDTVRKNYYVDFTFSGPAEVRESYTEVNLAVSVTPFSFAYVPQNGTSYARIVTASVLSKAGFPVVNAIGNLEACALDTYNADVNDFAVSLSQEPSCYPLVDLVLLITRSRYFSVSDMSTKVAIMTARFMQYVIERSIRQNPDTMTILTSSLFGTLSDFADQVVNITNVNNDLLNSITLDGVSVLIVPQNMNWIPPALVAAFYFLLCVELLVYVCLAMWVLIHRNRKLIRNSSPAFMVQVLFGATLMGLTVVPLAQQDDYRLPYAMTLAELNQDEPTLDAACVAEPILFSVGFSILFSALFLKSWRLIRIFNNHKLRHLFLKDRQLFYYQIVVLFIVVCLNLIWALQSPLVWQRSPLFIDASTNMVVNSAGLCYSRTEIYPALPLTICILLSLVFGNYIAYIGRRIPTEFNESKWIAMSMVVALEAIALGVPVLVLANDQPVAGFVVKASLCLVIPGATVALIFFPKVAMAYGWGVIEGESNPWRFVKASSASNSKGSSKIVQPGGTQVPGTGEDGSRNSKNHENITPSLTSLVSGKVLVTTRHQDSSRPSSKKVIKDPGTSSVAQLKQVLDSDPTRRRFRRYLHTLKMDENIRFWDSVTIFRTEVNPDKRAVSAKAIILTFVLDTAPLQVNLSSHVKDEIIAAFQKGDKAQLGSEGLFDKAMDELFQDLRQSDAFRTFLENDTFSATDLLNSKSDPLVIPVE